MSILKNNDPEYREWIQELSKRFRQSQIKAAVRVNTELIRFYWSLGEDIVNRQMEKKYGAGIIETISRDLQADFPNTKGFSRRNLFYARKFYLLYCERFKKVQQVVAQFDSAAPSKHEGTTNEEVLFSIPWGHHCILIDKIENDPDKALFFVRKTIENGWSRSMLLNFLDTNLYERSGKAVHNFETALPSTDSDLAEDLLKDPYNFDFLTLTDNYKEKDLQKALEQHVTNFLIELGTCFAFVGRQVRLEVGGDEFYCDLLFYHLKLRRYVVIELKTKKFQPEFVSKVNFYCTAVDHLLKGPYDQDTIGLLICKEKNDLVAKWTVEKNQLQPIGISEYELSTLLSKELPSIEQDED